MTHPYSDLPPTAYWRSGVAEADPLAPLGLYRKKFTIAPDDAIATAGSCFAQHIARHMKRHGFKVLDMERPPQGTPPALAREYGYQTYSARYGNLYHVRQFLQLVKEARGREPAPDIVWERDGRYFDALRPAVEPNGLDSADEVLAHRRAHLDKVYRLLNRLDVMVFTLGLTEAWVDRESGRVYPTCPGVVAGRFDAERHVFHNFTYEEILADLQELRRLLQRKKPEMRLLLTVSPVPLTATASGGHVLPATTYSKAVLRAAAGRMADLHGDVDYFPSYEIITHPASRGSSYEPNLRSVADAGVNTVMSVFFAEHGSAAGSTARAGKRRDRLADAGDDVQCEEELLDAFNRS